MKRESRWIEDVSRDQESKFPSLLGSGNKILTKITALFTKKYTSFHPVMSTNFSLKFFSCNNHVITAVSSALLFCIRFLWVIRS